MVRVEFSYRLFHFWVDRDSEINKQIVLLVRLSDVAEKKSNLSKVAIKDNLLWLSYDLKITRLSITPTINSSSSFSSSSSSYHQKEFIGKMGFSTMTIFVLLLLLGVVSGYHYNISDHTHTHSPWEGFLNLSGCHTGEHRKGLSTVKNYFHKFGYLNTSGNFSDDFDSDLQNALINYQRFFHLNCTGTLDNSTVEFMTLPRCGVSDVVAGSNSSTRGRNLYSYFSGEPTWDKTDLTYAFSTNSPFNHSIYQTVRHQ